MSDAEWLNTAEAAALLGCAEITLRTRRCATYAGPPGPPYVKTKFNRILYRRSDLLAWNEFVAPPRAARPPRPVSPAPRPTR